MGGPVTATIGECRFNVSTIGPRQLRPGHCDDGGGRSPGAGLRPRMGRNRFSPDTPVWTTDGLVPIGELVVGDTDLFGNHWQQIHFGLPVQGAVFEIRVTAAPEKISMLDGYLTVDFGTWHFHICIGEHKGSRNHPVDPELAYHRRIARAELYRRMNQEGTLDSWGLRLFIGCVSSVYFQSSYVVTTNRHVLQWLTAITCNLRPGPV